ncbi:hypothetical protein [Lactiplantibacillus plantarum]|uniref:hypothetical protein n=1 Tax=Lactiplantibacillus plantarum TaxID=1590 RepID=UPI0040455858
MHTALFLLACLAAYGLATYLLQVPLWVGLAYLSLSLITIAFYTWDKGVDMEAGEDPAEARLLQICDLSLVASDNFCRSP